MDDARYNFLVNYSKDLQTKMIDDLFPNQKSFKSIELILVLALNLDCLATFARLYNSSLNPREEFIHILDIIEEHSEGFLND